MRLTAMIAEKVGTTMKWLLVLSVAAALVLASSSAASAQSTGPLAGLEAICLSQGGSWYPNGFIVGLSGYPTCGDVNFIVLTDMPGSYASSQLVAVGQLCEAAGFGSVFTFGKGLGVPGYSVGAWVCV